MIGMYEVVYKAFLCTMYVDERIRMSSIIHSGNSLSVHQYSIFLSQDFIQYTDHYIEMNYVTEYLTNSIEVPLNIIAHLDE